MSEPFAAIERCIEAAELRPLPVNDQPIRDSYAELLAQARAELEAARELLAAVKELLPALTPELTGNPKNVRKSAWAEEWERTEKTIAACQRGGQK